MVRVLFALCMAALVAAPGVWANDNKSKGAIKKCQDVKGRWHYGDSAAAECERSKIIEMNSQGMKTGEIGPPPTAEELREGEIQKAEGERLKKIKAEEDRKDALLLNTYSHEDDIFYARDRRIKQVKALVEAKEDTVKSLQAALERMELQKADAQSVQKTRDQIAEHQQAIDAANKEIEAIRLQADEDTARFKRIKATGSGALPSPGAPSPKPNVGAQPQPSSAAAK